MPAAMRWRSPFAAVLLGIAAGFAVPSTGQFAPPRSHATSTVTGGSVWPAPAIASLMANKTTNAADDGSRTLLIDPADFAMAVHDGSGGGQLLIDALERLRNATFMWSAAAAAAAAVRTGAAAPLPLLRRLDVAVAANGEPGHPTARMNESYSLDIWLDCAGGASCVPTATLRSGELWGALRGLQTFAQLVRYNFSTSLYSIDITSIEDFPRYAHRGIMLDTARRFYPISTMLKVLDGMEAAKLNVLHWHATDNEAFPLVLPSHPELAAAGAFTAHGHRYSVEDMKLIVSEARRRAIRVIVEFDTPGHVGGFCRSSHDTCVPAGYTGMGCLLDPSNLLTWSLLNDTFNDLMDIFPDEQLMIGGDEVTSSVWSRESKVLIWETQHQIGNPDQIGAYFARWLANLLKVRGRRAVAWAPGVADDSDAVAMNMTYNVDDGWSPFGPRSAEGLATWQEHLAGYTKQGLNVILSAPWYLTKADGRGKCDVNNTTGSVRCPVTSDWSEFYAIDPGNFTGSEAQKDRVIGGECTAWNDNTHLDASTLLSALFPVCSGMAEQLWSPRHLTELGPTRTTYARLSEHRCMLVARGIPAAVPSNGPDVGWAGDVGFCPVEFSYALSKQTLKTDDSARRMKGAALTTYPPHRGAELSSLFTVSVQQHASADAPTTSSYEDSSSQDAPVFSTVSNKRCSQIPEAKNKDECWCPAGHSQAWASFWFSGAPVIVMVTKADGWADDWSQITIRPQFTNLTATKINDTTLSFVVSPRKLGWKLSVESPSQLSPAVEKGSACEGYPRVVQHSLMIFADPQTLAPDPTTNLGLKSLKASPKTRNRLPKGMLYFGAGFHNLGGQMPLPANVTSVYIAGGAWVSGGFISSDRNSSVNIIGRGVVSGSAQIFLKDPAGWGPCSYNGSYCWSLVNLDEGANHRVEGLVLHDPPKYYFRSLNGPRLVLNGVKMVGAFTPNSDGLDTGPGGIVRDTFIRSSDDSIKLFADDMRISDCVVWQGRNGGVFQLGWWSSHSLHDIDIRRITVLHAEWKRTPKIWARDHPQNDAIFDLRGPGGGTPNPSQGGMYNVTNITWQDIVIDSSIMGGGLLRMDLAAATGSVAHLSFNRIEIPAPMPSSFHEMANQSIRQLSFKDLEVAGMCVRSVDAAGFDPPPVDISFTCSTGNKRTRGMKPAISNRSLPRNRIAMINGSRKEAAARAFCNSSGC